MLIAYDPAKRELTLQARDLDMAEAAMIFAGTHLTIPDERKDYGEPRFITFGTLDGRMVVAVWTKRGDTRRIMSLRKANDREQTTHGPSLRP